MNPRIYQDVRTQLWGISDSLRVEHAYYEEAGMSIEEAIEQSRAYGGVPSAPAQSIWFATEQMCEVWRAFVHGVAHGRQKAEATK